MAAEYRQAEREPRQERTPILGAHNGRRANAEGHAERGGLGRQLRDTRPRGRRMPKEWVEHNLRGASTQCGSRIVGVPHFGRQHKSVGIRDGLRFRPTRHGLHVGCRGNSSAPLSEQCLMRPIAAHGELIRGTLPQMIDFTDRNEEAVRKPARLERAQYERRLTDAPELLTQNRSVERPFGRRCKRDFRRHGDFFSVRRE